MMILGVDTSSRTGSVALIDGATVVAETASESAASFSRQLLGMIGQLLDRQGIALEQLDLIAIATGPGSFTGIRIGVSTAEGIGLAAGIPVIGIGTLEATARASGIAGRCAVALDAGNGNIYHALFEAGNNGIVRLSPDTFSPRAGIDHGAAPRVGDGWQDGRGLTVSVAAGAALRASELLAGGTRGEELRAVPNYVQKSAAEKNQPFSRRDPT